MCLLHVHLNCSLGHTTSEVSHVHKPIAHTLSYSFSLNMCHLDSRLVIDARYIPITRSDTQAEESHVHTHITHTLIL